ncbi:MAG: HDOD domain-containing protein [Candidatus Hydrogenedentes bacterium]|nr:HDOD domain-containing protein [Candidatus Hydrogenedentota bacterium]
MTECPFCSAPIEIEAAAADRGFVTLCESCMNPLAARPEGAGWRIEAVRGVPDTRRIAQKGSIGEALLGALPEAAERLPVLPDIAHRVLAMVRDPETSIQQLAEVIRQDQVMALRIMQLANSVLYGGLSPIKDLNNACARLGLKTVSNAVQAVANGRLYVTNEPEYREVMKAFHRHSVATAYCANEIAVMTAQASPDTFFVAGLLHDLGKPLLLDLATNALAAARHAQALDSIRRSRELLFEMIRGYCALVGLFITRRWNLPVEFAVVAFCHARIEAVPDEGWLTLVHTVSLASALADASGYGMAEDAVSLLGHPSTKYLGLNDIKLATLRVDLDDKLKALLEVTTAG